MHVHSGAGNEQVLVCSITRKEKSSVCGKRNADKSKGILSDGMQNKGWNGWPGMVGSERLHSRVVIRE
jgi:hypothetical protein